MRMLILHAAVTWCLVGLIWTIQWVHYPLMDAVDERRFSAFHALHSERVTWLVGPLMIAEAALAAFLVQRRPPEVPSWAPVIGLLLVLVVWCATAFLSVPQHNRLAHGFDAEAHHRLVVTNWVRTVAWTARGVIAAAMIDRLFSAGRS